MSRVRLRVDGGGVWWAGPASLRIRGRYHPLRALQLDTGCDVALVVPASWLDDPPPVGFPTSIAGLGGRAPATVFTDCVLELGPWWRNEEVFAVDALDHALLGHPVLRDFDLLLRGDDGAPAVVGPAAEARFV